MLLPLGLGFPKSFSVSGLVGALSLFIGLTALLRSPALVVFRYPSVIRIIHLFSFSPGSFLLDSEKGLLLLENELSVVLLLVVVVY